MQPPTTQEEIDRRENASSSVQLVRDIMDSSEGLVTDNTIRLKMLKSMLGNVISDTEVIDLLEEMIAELESEAEAVEEETNPTESSSEEPGFNPSEPLDFNNHEDDQDTLPTTDEINKDNQAGPEEESTEDKNEPEALPSPNDLSSKHDLGDFSDMTNPNFEM